MKFENNREADVWVAVYVAVKTRSGSAPAADVADEAAITFRERASDLFGGQSWPNKLPVYVASFNSHAMSVLNQYSIDSLGDLVELRREDLLKMSGMGVATTNHVERVLSKLGLGLRTDP